MFKIILKNKLAIVSVGFFLIILGIFFLIIQKDKPNEVKTMEHLNIHLGECDFKSERAVSFKEKSLGLSYRKSLCESCAMFFEFNELGRYNFWMKDMRFPLDFIWLKDGEVLEITREVNQSNKSKLFSKEAVNGVLEINSGYAKTCNIKVGDKLKK